MNGTDGSLAAGMARAGMDPRAHVTMGIVEPEAGDQHSVLFDDPTGKPLPYGVLVMVKLAPNGNVLPCRVASSCAEPQGGEYHPFVGGDEVLVCVPDGDEKNGGVIVGRMNQEFDAFPRAVAGQDTTKNSVAFKRLTAPYLLESGTSLILRVASTGAALTLDPTGNTYLSSGSGASLYLRSDAVSLQLKDGAAGFQLDPSDSSAKVVAGDGDTVLHMDGKADAYQTQGSLAFSTSGNAGTNHLTTIEAVLNLLATVAPLINPLVYTTPAQAAAAFAAVLPAVAALPLMPPYATSLPAALAIPKPFSPAEGTPPGICSQGLLSD